MAKPQRQFWVLVVDTTEVEKHGPYLDERVADEEARSIVKEIWKKDVKRLQAIRVMLMVMYSANDFRFEVYEPGFILDLVK